MKKRNSLTMKQYGDVVAWLRSQAVMGCIDKKPAALSTEATEKLGYLVNPEQISRYSRDNGITIKFNAPRGEKKPKPEAEVHHLPPRVLSRMESKIDRIEDIVSKLLKLEKKLWDQQS